MPLLSPVLYAGEVVVLPSSYAQTSGGKLTASILVANLGLSDDNRAHIFFMKDEATNPPAERTQESGTM